MLNDIFDDSDSDEDEEWFPSPDSHLESVDSENIMSLTSQSENTPPVVNINQHISFMVNWQMNVEFSKGHFGAQKHKSKDI